MTPPNTEAAHSGADSRPKTRPKQAMIRAAQQSALDELARDLHDSRTVKGERITANTLIRVAIDGVVPHGDRLHGDNEEQLRSSWLDFLAQAEALRAAQPRVEELAHALRAADDSEADEITASVLVRMAVEGLLCHTDRLRGHSEAELTASWLAFLNERTDPEAR